MIILGIDPGIATTGVGIIEKKGSSFTMIQVGAILTKPDLPLSKRLDILYSELALLIQTHNPAHVAIEELFFNTNAKTALIVGQARGVILLCAEKHQKQIAGYTPLQVKMAVCGYGRADKKQVQYMVQKLLHLEKIPKPDDAADALAIAICHGHSHRLNEFGRRPSV